MTEPLGADVVGVCDRAVLEHNVSAAHLELVAFIPIFPVRVPEIVSNRMGSTPD